MTVIDDNQSLSGLSEIRSQRSRRLDNHSNFGGLDIHNIIEEENENDMDEEEIEQQVLIASQQEEAKSHAVEGNNPSSLHRNPKSQSVKRGASASRHSHDAPPKREKPKQRQDPSKDNTTRGKIRQAMSATFDFLKKYFEVFMDIAIVHINKWVLLVLFLVSVSRPTVLNVLLFVMFLILSMVTHQNEHRYLRLTLLINSCVISVIFLFDTFIQRDFSTIRPWVLAIIGVQYRRENIARDLVRLKYLPYIALQMILCLSSYVFQSDRYVQFKKQYMDIDSQKKNMLEQQKQIRLKQSDKALSSRHSRQGGRSRPALSRISKSIIDGEKS